MLILTRQKDERIVIDKEIVITIISVSPGQVRFGIEAPPSVAIHRKEIYEMIKQQGEEVKSETKNAEENPAPADC